jgi:hypothetical protein
LKKTGIPPIVKCPTKTVGVSNAGHPLLYPFAQKREVKPSTFAKATADKCGFVPPFFGKKNGGSLF